MAVCSKMGDFKQHDSEYYKLAKGHRARIEGLGCLYPCTYTEYNVGNHYKGKPSQATAGFTFPPPPNPYPPFQSKLYA